MPVHTKSVMAQTADDLMSRALVFLREDMTLRDAAQLMLRNQIGGAPVVNTQGECVGVLSAFDFLRLAQKRTDTALPAFQALPITCSFQTKHRTRGGIEVTRCALPPGVCPIQVQHAESEGKEFFVCGQPHCVLVDWQVVDVETLPTEEVRRFMTSTPVTVQPTTSIRVLARMMIDAHIHRLIVVDQERRPIGLVSSTDILAALAFSDDEG